jgi:hypothetical protein
MVAGGAAVPLANIPPGLKRRVRRGMVDLSPAARWDSPLIWGRTDITIGENPVS